MSYTVSCMYLDIYIQGLKQLIRLTPAPPYTDTMEYQEVLKAQLLQWVGPLCFYCSFMAYLDA